MISVGHGIYDDAQGSGPFESGGSVTEVSELFSAALSEIEPKDDVDHAISARDEVVDALKSDPTLIDWGIDPVLIGSYKRHTSIRRIKDVDVFCRMNKCPDDAVGADVLAHFETVLEESFEGRTTLQGRSVQVAFETEDIFVDAVPARKADDVWEIPCKDPSDGWELTNPEKLTSLSSALNLQLDERYVPIVKLMRQARRSLIGDARPRGLTAEILTYWSLEPLAALGSTAEGFVVALEGSAELVRAHLNGEPIEDPAMPGTELRMGASTRELESLAAKLETASADARAALDNADDCASARVFRRILGKGWEGDYVFPLPPGCSNSEASARSIAIVPGADDLPSGDSPRFA